ncbi:MAG TPA: hypothetical protein VF283_10535 [Bryobacteraceae bacterium]
MSLRNQLGVCGDIEKAVAEDLAAVSAVTHVITQAVDNGMLVWIVVDDPKLDVRYEIFDKEQALIDAFPETEFDFNIIPRMGRDASELIQGEAHIAYTRSSAIKG